MNFEKIRTYLPLVFMVLANLLPIYGVLYWGWSLPVLLFLYWLESFVIGGVNVLQILSSNGLMRERIRTTLFFIVHYGGFWLGHGLFLFVFLMPEIDKYVGAETAGVVDSAVTVRWAFWGFVVSHLVSFFIYIMNYPREKRLPPIYQMFTPYSRVFIMHVVILGGAFLAARFANITSVVLLFAGLKILFEFGSMALRKNWRNQLETRGEIG